MPPARQVMPVAKLESREGDVDLSYKEFLELSLFKQLKSKPNLDKYPGTIKLRHYQPKDIIVRQGEAGWTAFYILTSADVLSLYEKKLAAANDQTILQQRLRVGQLDKADQDDPLRTAAMVFLAVAHRDSSSRSAVSRLFNVRGPSLAGPIKNVENKTIFIPVDGPVTPNYDSLRAPLQEGELFGEMSCLYRTPRSGTIRAERECYVIEMLRHLLTQVQRDPVYKARTDAVYKKRVLELQMRKQSIFHDMTDAEYAQIRDRVELISVEHDSILTDEHDRSDSLYIVRTGLVKVMTNVSSLVSAADVNDWAKLGAALREGAAQPATPRGKVWQLLDERMRANFSATAPERLNSADRAEMLYALNEIIKTPKLVEVTAFNAVVEKLERVEENGRLLAKRAELLKKRKDWDEATLRRFNRRLLEEVLGTEALRPRALHAGPEIILTYCARGDFFGEMGLIQNGPRTATCVAYGHPKDDPEEESGQVELVKLSARDFWRVLGSNERLRTKIKAEAEMRRRHTARELRTPPDEDTQVQTSERFEELGLIQGQKLMLIDLDRCTRCDECVKACVATHDDGNSRLFLDGPRFGKYLVPTTCRSCLDPVCMIGCPVGSIHRGDNREIVVEDWCIGCSLCADSCPYGSIQMHDLGVVHENARGWRFLPAAQLSGDRWRRPGFRDGSWLVGDAPFRLDREMSEQLASRRPRTIAVGMPVDQIAFRHEFQLAKSLLSGSAEFRLEVVSMAPSVTVWVNGEEVKPDEKPKRGRHEFTLSSKAKEGEAVRMPLRAGANVIAVQVAPTTKADDLLMQARLDAVRRPELPESVDAAVAEEVTEKLVTTRAVVCDLCSTLTGQSPACVHACPHDAAMRVDARSEFPVR